MSRELRDFRVNLELINTGYPGIGPLKVGDVAEIFGWKSLSTVYCHFNVTRGSVPRVDVARELCRRCTP